MQAQEEIANNLGVEHFRSGRLEEALAAFRRAVELRPDFAFALDNVGSTLQRLGRAEEARSFHERAVAADPTFARAHVNYANALVRLQESDAALGAFRRALELDPKNAEALNGIGAMVQAQGHEEEAIASYRAALAINPEYAEASCNLGAALRTVGDADEAMRWFARAIELEPRNARYYRYLGETRPESEGSAMLQAMENLARELSSLSIEHQVELHFALGKAYTDIGRYDEAFAHLELGNAKKRSEIDYNEPVQLAFLANLPHSFSETFQAILAGAGNPSDRPLFVFGLPRSGTTLVEQILSAHPSVHGAGELDAIERVIHAMPQIGANSTVVDMQRAIRALGDSYLEATGTLAPDAKRVVDKMPMNSLFAPLIHLALPNARLIDVRRNLLDTCLSCYSTHFVTGIAFSYDLGELGRYARAHQHLMDRWHAMLPSDRFLRVDYEHLVTNFEEEARRIVEFCGLPWNDRCLEFHTVRRAVRTASHSQVRKPLYRNAVGRAQRFGEQLRPLIDALNGE